MRPKHTLLLAVAGVLALVAAVPGAIGCAGQEEPEAPTTTTLELEVPEFDVTSSAFADGEPITERHTADGENLSPPLSWSGHPEGTDGFALVVDDPDAPREEPFVHWVVYGLPAEVTSLPEGIPPGEAPEALRGGVHGRNDFGNRSYDGPAPPEGSGPHRYRFTVYALASPPELESGLTKSELLAEISQSVIARGRLIGIYER
ncbi:MAG: hypothetical protein Kow00122_12100 [Thermoleophilia bacterium]